MWRGKPRTINPEVQRGCLANSTSSCLVSLLGMTTSADGEQSCLSAVPSSPHWPRISSTSLNYSNYYLPDHGVCYLLRYPEPLSRVLYEWLPNYNIHGLVEDFSQGTSVRKNHRTLVFEPRQCYHYFRRITTLSVYNHFAEALKYSEIRNSAGLSVYDLLPV